MSRKDSPRDGFFTKVLVSTVVVIWVALVGGNWLGHFAIQKGYLGKAEQVEFKKSQGPRPKPWVTVDPKIQDELDKTRDRKPAPTTAAETPQEPVVASPVPENSPSRVIQESTPQAQPTPEARTEPTPEPRVATSEPPKPTPRLPEEVKPTPETRTEPKPASDAPVPTPAAPSESAGGSSQYQLQFGSFSSSDNARRLADELSSKGQEARVEEIETANGKVYRVRGGAYSEDQARSQIDKLKDKNVDAYIVNP